MKEIGDIIGPAMVQTDFAEVGCNTTYFLQSLALKGAKRCTGYDRTNYASTVKFLNELLGTNVRFKHRWYDGRTSKPANAPAHDVVLSVATICHIPDTLQHLAYLGAMGKQGLFVWTPVVHSEEYSIHYGEPNRYYSVDEFPYCFDNLVRPTSRMLLNSLKLMGFEHQYILPDPIPNGGLTPDFYGSHLAVLAARPNAPFASRLIARQNEIGAGSGPMETGERKTKLLKQAYRGYNILSHEGKLYALDIAMGSMVEEIIAKKDSAGDSVLMGDSLESLVQKVDRVVESKD